MKGGRDRPITDKEEIFVQKVVEGKSQRVAYREAYPNTRMKDSSVDVKASQLLKKDKVWLRYQELKEEAKERTLWSYERAQEELIEMLDDSKSAKNFMGRYNAIKELNALAGFYDKKKEEKEDRAGNFFEKLGDLI